MCLLDWLSVKMCIGNCSNVNRKVHTIFLSVIDLGFEDLFSFQMGKASYHVQVCWMCFILQGQICFLFNPIIDLIWNSLYAGHKYNNLHYEFS